MYASENLFSNLVFFPERNQPAPEKIIYYCQFTKISRKYVAQIEQEFLSLSQLFSLNFHKIGEAGYETLSIFLDETPVISYLVCIEAIIGSTNLQELDFLYQAVKKYSKVFDSDSIIAFLVRAIESPSFLEKR